MKVAFLGIAHMHILSYLEYLKKNQIEIIGVYDYDSKKKKEFSDKENIMAFESIDKLLSSNCDAVIICSENVYHKELALLAAGAGKHIMVEKPMALSVFDCDEMINAAKINGVKLMVAHPVRMSETIQDLKNYLKSKPLGKLMSINSSNHGKNPGGWFVNKQLSGGGCLVDHSVHILDLINYLFKLKPLQIEAWAQNSDKNLEVEDIGLVSLQLDNGIIMSLDTSWNRPDSFPVWGDALLELVFEKGYIVVDGFGRKLDIYSNQQGFKQFYYDSDMDEQLIQSFIKMVSEKNESEITGLDGLYTVRVIEAINQSLQEKTSVKVG